MTDDTSKNEKAPKDETYYKICNTVLRLQVEKGHLLWKVSDIAKYSGVTRSLIYYYFGKEKQVIYEEAMRFMIDLLFPSIGDEEKGVAKRMVHIQKHMKDMPYLFIVYYLEKDQDTIVGDLLRKAEMIVLDRLQKQYNLDEVQATRLYLTELGAIAYKTLNIKQTEEVFSDFKL